MTATERFKRLLSDALERVCVLEEQLELARQEIARLRDEPEPPMDETRVGE